METSRLSFPHTTGNTLTILSTALVLLANIPFNTPIGGIVFVVWIASIVVRLTGGMARTRGKIKALFLASILSATALTLAAVILFFLKSTTPIATAIALVALTGSALQKPYIRLWRSARLPTLGISRGLTLGILGCQAVIVFFLIVARTTEPLVSPWTILPSSIFLLFFCATLLTIRAQTIGANTTLVLAMFQTFLAVAVSAIVYGIGFGFDPFVHRAAETALVANGFIEPTTLLYSGQYALVGFLHFLTGISIRTIDIWLLPLFISIFLPVATYLGLRDGWRVPERIARLGWLFALSTPFMLLTFTVPFTLSYATFIASTFLFPLVRNRRTAITLLGVATLLPLFHALLGVPTFILFAGATLWYHAPSLRQRIAALGTLTCLTAISVPGLMWLYQSDAGVSVNPANLLWNIGSFLHLFANPFGPYDPDVTPFYNGLYIFRYWQPVTLLLATLLLAPLAKRYRNETTVLFAFLLGMLWCTYGVSTLFTFKDIIRHEQHEFALRLLQAIYVIPLPFLAVAATRLAQGQALRILGVTFLSVTCTASWYFSYPQFNAKFAYYSPSVSTHDVAVVHAIHNMSDGKPYLVLSNQMTSAAALQEFGFAHYYQIDEQEVLWYAIPTGGALYQYYLSAISHGDPTTFRMLAAQSNVESVYVVMHAYWSWHPELVAILHAHANDVITIPNQITVYRFDK